MGQKLDLQCWRTRLRVQVAVGTGAGFEPDYCWAEGWLKVSQAGAWVSFALFLSAGVGFHKELH